MTSSARKLLEDVLALPESERLELVSEIIASVDGPQDADWGSVWLSELDRRSNPVDTRAAASEWTEARARILSQLGRR
jgi:hypothetical protein